MPNHSWLRGRTLVYNQVPIQKPNTPKGFSPVGILKSVLRFVWKIIKGIALAIGLMILILLVMGICSAMKSDKSALPTLPDSMVLSLTLDKNIPQTNGVTQILSLIRGEKAPLTLEDIVDSIDQAAKDNRVKVLAFKANGGGYNLTQLQSIREAVLRFKASGKKSVIFSESYGEGGYGLGIYFLASAFDEIWMQPVGNVAIGGINMQAPFFKDAMDKYGVEAQFFQRKEYKNAMEHLTSNHMSPASRESMESIIADLSDQLVKPVRTSRQQVLNSFETLLNKGYLIDKVALKEGLIDKLDYEDKMISDIQKEVKGVQFVPLERYNAVIKRKSFEKTLLSKNKKITIAVIPIDGMILSGAPKSSPFGMNGQFAGADDIVEAIQDAANDNSVKAIVLRVNSPGGSPTASETIHRAVVWAKTVKNKKVIVSMGGLAASGGYWISTPADKIYAMDSTLTGSIGVVGGKVNLQGIWDKLGVKWETVKFGDNSGMMSFNTPFSESEQKQFELSLDNIYDYFIARVAEGRKLPLAQVEEIAKGRAFTGRQALALGLVDEIGGMDKVLDDLAKANGVTSREYLNIVYLPMLRDPMQLLLMMISERVGITPVIEKISSTLAPILALEQSAPMVYEGQRLVN